MFEDVNAATSVFSSNENMLANKTESERFDNSYLISLNYYFRTDGIFYVDSNIDMTCLKEISFYFIKLFNIFEVITSRRNE